MNANILVVEDQLDINELIALNLQTQHYQVTRCFNGLQGYQLAQKEPFDLIVLDIMLPDMDGLQICQKLRASEVHTPILMLTAKKSEIDRVVGLEMGADDYLTKPFSVRELLARVKAQLRRAAFSQDQQGEQSTCIAMGELYIDISKRLVQLRKQELCLTAKEFDLLVFLAQSPGQVFTRERLLNAVWGYQHSGYEHTVNSHINRLRNKLEDDPGNPVYVRTVWGVGYKMDCLTGRDDLAGPLKGAS